MQTFLPYEDFTKSAQSLDYRRLGKQRVETLQLLAALFGEKQGWRNHPAAKMWEGSEYWLVVYGLQICSEWTDRGYKDTCAEKIDSYRQKALQQGKTQYPSWLGDEAFHRSHRANLVRKNYEYYSPQFLDIGDDDVDMEYIWPRNNFDKAA